LIPVPRSEAKMGNAGYSEDNPIFIPNKQYTIEAFGIEPYEVTNGRYLLCVESRHCSLPTAPPSSYSGNKNTNLPVVNITAIQANQFCEWLGRQLPTELEWERVARYTDERPWPWGESKPTPEQANFFYDTEPMLQPTGMFEKGKSEEGVYDLAGNAFEWTDSEYNNPESLAAFDLNVAKGDDRLSVRGGGYNVNYESMNNTIAFRFPASPFTSNNAIGFRCVSR
jgi:formylglycine-generating enzyme required for sulfatase activity